MLNRLNSLGRLMNVARNWPTVVKRKLGARQNDPCVVELREGLRVQLRAGMKDWFVFNEIFLRRVYQIAVEHIEKAPPGSVVLDCGGNMGYFSLQAAAANRSVRVRTFEPGPPHAAIIRWHIENNGEIGSRIELSPVAVGGDDETLRWNMDETNPGGSSIGRDPGRGLEVIVRRFASVIAETSGPIALAKIDIEGSEHDLVRKTPPEAWTKVDAVLIEVHDDPSGISAPLDVVNSLRTHGYVVRELDPTLFFLRRE